MHAATFIWYTCCCSAFQPAVPHFPKRAANANSGTLKLRASGNLMDWGKERGVQTGLELATFDGGLRGMRTRKPLKVRIMAHPPVTFIAAYHCDNNLQKQVMLVGLAKNKMGVQNSLHIRGVVTCYCHAFVPVRDLVLALRHEWHSNQATSWKGEDAMLFQYPKMWFIHTLHTYFLERRRCCSSTRECGFASCW